MVAARSGIRATPRRSSSLQWTLWLAFSAVVGAGPARGSRLCRSRRSLGNSGEWVPVGTTRWPMAGGDVRGRVTDGSDSPVAVGWSDRAIAMTLETVPDWLWLRLKTWVALATANGQARETRDGERREEATWGTRWCRDTAFTWCVCNCPWGWRERAELNCLALAGFAARRLGDSAAWRPVGSGPVADAREVGLRWNARRSHSTKPSRGWLWVVVVVRKPRLILAATVADGK